MSESMPDTARQQGDLWSAAGHDWAERFAPMFAPLWTASHDLARVTVGTRLLDVGCGSGEALALARLRGADVAGLDAAPDLLEIASERLPRATFRVGTMEDLPFDDGAFDAVTLVNSIMYAEDPIMAIREAGRVVSADGRIAMAVWAEPEVCDFRHVMGALRELLPAPPEGDGPFTLAGDGALEGAMVDAGVDPVEVRDVPTPFVFMDDTHYLRAIKGTGPGQGVLEQVGEAAVDDALLALGDRFRGDDGAYTMENAFRVVAATPGE